MYHNPSAMPAYTFLYDDACPMCKGYTRVFDSAGVSGRRAFSGVGPDAYPALDLNRGRHEIPVVETATGHVYYGLDGMTRAIANRFPALHVLLRSSALQLSLKPLYWLITYNRRVIAGTKPPAQGFDCAPDYHAGWRWTYVALALAAVLAIGLPLTPGVWLFAAALALGLWRAADRLTFLGHFATVAMIFAAVAALLPGELGQASAFAIAGLELWRRK